MSSVAVRWRFERGEATAAEIDDVAREVLAELHDPASEASAAATAAGLDPASVRDARAEVAEGEQGAEPILTTIIVGIVVSAGSKVAETLWKYVVWPRVRRRLGARALGTEKERDQEG